MEKESGFDDSFFRQHEYRDLLDAEKEEVKLEKLIAKEKRFQNTIDDGEEGEGGSMLRTINAKMDGNKAIEDWLQEASRG